MFAGILEALGDQGTSNFTIKNLQNLKEEVQMSNISIAQNDQLL